MPFFPQAYLPEAALIQLLSELDQAPQQKQQQQQQHPACIRRVQRPQTFKPRFDVTETNEAYELYGEVPGLQQQDLDIQFADAQTLIIKGKTERALNSHTPAAAAVPELEPEQATQADDTASEKSHSATVEDDYDEADTPLATPASTSSTPTAAEKGKAPESSSSSSAATAQEAPRAKYWVAERKVGEFARSFAFEQRIEQDFVTASLQNGILSVVVPKSLKNKKVTVSVL